MKLLKKYKITPFEAGLFILLFIQFILLAVSNLTLIDMNLDCDNAKLFRHIVEMWRNKAIFIPDWSYTTTVEIDCASLFALPIYGITKNIYLAYGLSNIILTAIFIASLFFLFRGKSFLYPLLCANIIIIPYRIGMLDYFNMMFFCGAQYIIKVLIPILLVGIILFLENLPESKAQKRIGFFFILFYIFLLCLTSISSGTYVTFCGLLPLFIVYPAYKFLKWEKFPTSSAVLFGISAICIVVGICINSNIMGGTRGDSMSLCHVGGLLANITTCFFGFFELFGGATTVDGIAILSYEGIALLGKFALCLILLICGIIAFMKCLKKKADMRILLLLSIFVWNYLILTIADTRAGSVTHEYRYHLIGAIPLICVACIILIDGFLKTNAIQQRVLYFIGCTAIIFIFGTSYYTVFTHGEQNPDLKELTDYCAALDIDHAYMYKASNDSDICRIMDLETQYIHMYEDGTTYVYDYYNYYLNEVVQPLNSIIVVDNEMYDFGDAFTIPKYQLVKFAEVGNRSLYKFDL